MMNKAGKNIL